MIKKDFLKISFQVQIFYVGMFAKNLCTCVKRLFLYKTTLRELAEAARRVTFNFFE